VGAIHDAAATADGRQLAVAARSSGEGVDGESVFRQGRSLRLVATAAMKGLSVAEKNELLFQNGVNFNDLPLWQKRGSGL